jgi:photosystem II stability/assembly factor-like uncharacterized protein
MNSLPLLLATADGLYVCARDGSRWYKTLEGKIVTSVIAREGVILAGTETGVYRSDDLGQNWFACHEGLPHRQVQWLAFHPDVSDLELVGLITGEIFISRDGAESWQPITADADLAWREVLNTAAPITAVTTMYP